VKHGKRPASEKVLIKMVSSGKQRMFDVRVENDYNNSKWQRSSGVEQRTHKPLVGGSNPPAATCLFVWHILSFWMHSSKYEMKYIFTPINDKYADDIVTY
jgi:hypothetical protein